MMREWLVRRFDWIGLVMPWLENDGHPVALSCCGRCAWHRQRKASVAVYRKRHSAKSGRSPIVLLPYAIWQVSLYSDITMNPCNLSSPTLSHSLQSWHALCCDSSQSPGLLHLTQTTSNDLGNLCLLRQELPIKAARIAMA
jgi:hypothetical protein